MKFEELAALVNSVKGATFAGMDTETEVKLKGGKKNPMLGRVTKRTIGSNVIIYSNTVTNGYEAMVRRRIEKEGGEQESFTLKPRAFGTRIGNSPFIENGETKYLEVIFQNYGKSVYLLDGEEIAPEDIEGLDDGKPKSDEAKINRAMSQGGILDKVDVKTFKISSIKEIRLKGEVLKSE